MQVITKPSLYLISKPSLDMEEFDRFKEDNGIAYETEGKSDAEDLAVLSGRICYRSHGKPRPGGNEAYLRNIIESQHGSVLAHGMFVFMVTGVSRSLSHELIRHGVGTSVSELSQRFVDCKDVKVVLPPVMLPWWEADLKRISGKEAVTKYEKVQAANYEQWRRQQRNAIDRYDNDADTLMAEAPPELAATDRRKWARQAARSSLPNCAETQLVFGGSLRAWRNIIEQRCGPGADSEIRRLLNRVYEILVVECPNALGDYQKVELPQYRDGTYELRTANRKV